MQSRSVLLAVTLTGAGLLGAGCDSEGSSAPEPVTRDDIIGSWYSTVAVAGSELPYYWVFEPGGQYHGYDACNRVGGVWFINDGGALETDETGSTTRGCETSGGESRRISLASEPNVRMADDGATLVIDTSIGEVRLARVETVPNINP